MSQPQIQLSRYSINSAALDNLSAAWIPLPYAGAIERFRKAVETDWDKNVWTPYRQLNNALMACVPTLTHGFEIYENSMRRALVVGTAQNPVCPPTPGQLQHLERVGELKKASSRVTFVVAKLQGDDQTVY